MTILARAAAFAAAFTLVVASPVDAQAGKITVTIGGGPRAGTYEMTEECLVQPDAYPPMHIMAFVTGVRNPKAPSSMEFFTASKKGKPDGFVVSVLFPGGANGQDRYQIFAIPPGMAPGTPALSGSGTVSVKQTATGPTATFRGQTKDGVKMEGTVDCRSRS